MADSDTEEVDVQDVVADFNKNGYKIGYRHLQVFLLFIIMLMAFVIRASMSVAILAMTNTAINSTTIEVYDWDKSTQDFVLSSFFWGYMINQIPGGQLAQKYGGKMFILSGMLINGIILMIMPMMISLWGWYAACIARMLQGLTQSPMLPAMYIILSKWVPVNERSRLGNIVFAGGSFGTLIGFPLTSYLVDLLGWPKMFQIIGAFAIFVGMCWYFMGFDRPSKHPRISKEEQLFIEKSIGNDNHEVLRTPWKSFIRSVPVWALAIVHIGMDWCFLILFLETPTYINKVLGVDLINSGFLSSIPYITMWIFGIFISILADFLQNRKYFSVTVTRKLINTIAAWGYTFGLIFLSFIPKEEIIMSVACLTLTVGLSSSMTVGYMLNHMELTPNFSGVLMGITNCISSGVGVFAPISVGYIVDDSTSKKQWNIVFLMTSAVAFFTNLVFQIYGTSNKQVWNEPKGDIELTEVRKSLKSEK